MVWSLIYYVQPYSRQHNFYGRRRLYDLNVSMYLIMQGKQKRCLQASSTDWLGVVSVRQTRHYERL